MRKAAKLAAVGAERRQRWTHEDCREHEKGGVVVGMGKNIKVNKGSASVGCLDPRAWVVRKGSD